MENYFYFKIISSCSFRIQQVNSFETSQYKLNYLETPTGLKMVLNTDPNAAGIPELMRSIYQVSTCIFVFSFILLNQSGCSNISFSFLIFY